MVLVIVGILATVAGVFAHDVEKHLQAAGFTDRETESEQGTALLRDGLGYNPNPGIVVLLREPDGGRRAPSAASTGASA